MQALMILLSNKSEGEKQFNICDICYCESNNTKIHFWFKDRTCFTVTGNLSDFESVLEPYGFHRLQQSYLININCVDCVRRADKDVTMKNYPNVEINASRNSDRWEKFIKAWEKRALRVQRMPKFPS